MHAKRWPLGIWVLGALLLIARDGYSQNGVVWLRLGQEGTQRQMSYTITRCDLPPGGDAIVAVDINGQTVSVAPLALGRTTLTLIDGAGKARDRLDVVVGDRAGFDAKSVQSLLRDDVGRPIPTLAAEAIPGSEVIAITGTVMAQRDLDRIRTIRQVFGDNIIDLTALDATYFEKMAKEIREGIGNANVDVTHAGGVVFLSGLVSSSSEKGQIEAMARAMYPRIESFLVVRPVAMPDDVLLEKPLIQLQCQILEIKNDTAKQLGVDWGGIVPVTVGAGYRAENSGGSSGFVSVNTETLIRALIPQVQKGDAKVLYSQNLVCENGEQADFFAGGSFWIVAYLAGTDISTEEVEYGIKLAFEPKTDKLQNIETAVSIEFSSIGPEINKYPSLLKRTLKTSVNVKHGQTLSLGALLGTDMRKTITKIPALGDIPVLGELFRSTDYQEGKSEMVIFITPRVVTAGSSENVGLRQELTEKMAPGTTPKR
ncbi:MAG: hypothetical protein K8T26_09400 [Lentisphaerae bacterium]|nr:hypothetical protein [Lentisphaerota bacterium]